MDGEFFVEYGRRPVEFPACRLLPATVCLPHLRISAFICGTRAKPNHIREEPDGIREEPCDFREESTAFHCLQRFRHIFQSLQKREMAQPLAPTYHFPVKIRASPGILPLS
jgi:hypothetical protein